MDRIKRLAGISAYRPGGGQLLQLFEMLNGGKYSTRKNFR